MINNVRALYFPYCLQRRKDKLWVILNRNYKPVGTLNDEWSDYDALPANMCIKNVSGAQAKKLSYSGDSDNSHCIYLYNDGCVPTNSQADMDAYLVRVAVLMKLKTSNANG
jgi:hypothetical protein